jgi:hypothetical protein
MQMPDAVYHLMRETPLLQCSLASNVIAKIPPKFFISFNNLTGTYTYTKPFMSKGTADKTCRISHCNERSIYAFLFRELRGLSPNFHIHVSVSDLYIFPGSVHIFPAAE